jgi:hypothetical protein
MQDREEDEHERMLQPGDRGTPKRIPSKCPEDEWEQYGRAINSRRLFHEHSLPITRLPTREPVQCSIRELQQRSAREIEEQIQSNSLHGAASDVGSLSA